MVQASQSERATFSALSSNGVQCASVCCAGHISHKEFSRVLTELGLQVTPQVRARGGGRKAQSVVWLMVLCDPNC